MKYKIGERIHIPIEVRVDGDLVDITGYLITAKAKMNAVDGKFLGDFTRVDQGLGIALLTLDTAGFPPCELYYDVKVVSGSGEPVWSETQMVSLVKSVT